MEILHNGNGNWGNTKRIQDIPSNYRCYGKTQLSPLHPLGPSRGGMFILSSHNNPPTDAEKVQFITFLVGFVLPKSTFLAIVFVLSIPERYKTLIHTWIQFMHIGSGKKQSSLLGMERQFTTVPTCVANGFNLSWSIWYLFPNTNQLLVESPHVHWLASIIWSARTPRSAWCKYTFCLSNIVPVWASSFRWGRARCPDWYCQQPLNVYHHFS